LGFARGADARSASCDYNISQGGFPFFEILI